VWLSYRLHLRLAISSKRCRYVEAILAVGVNVGGEDPRRGSGVDGEAPPHKGGWPRGLQGGP